MSADITSTTCPKCHKKVSKDAQSCPSCGYKLDSATMPEKPSLDGWFSLGVILTLFFLFMLYLLISDAIHSVVLLVITFLVLAVGLLLILVELIRFTRQKKLYKLAQNIKRHI